MKQIAIYLSLSAISLLGTTQSLNSKNVLPMEQQLIINVIKDIFTFSDQKNWNKVEASFADKVVLDYTSLAGGSPVTLAPAEITGAWKEVLPGFRSTHHQVGNFSVKVDGDEATLTNSGLALHYLPTTFGGDTWVVVGTYDFVLVKEENKWKVSHMKFNLQKQHGNMELPIIAKQNVSIGITFNAKQPSKEVLSTVESFFTALEKMNIPSFLTSWNESGSQLMPLSPEGFPAALHGKNAIFNQYKGLPENFTSMSFPREVHATEDPNKVIVQYGGIIPLKSGGTYNNNYVGIFKIKDGKIQTFTEYFDPFILAKAFGVKLNDNFNVSSNEPKVEKVSFASEGLKLKGNLYLPPNYKKGNKYPTLLVGGSWTTVKEQMVGLYAQKLAEQGFVTLAFDPRNFGESEGAPRYYESPEMKIKDYKNAITYLFSRPEVDRERLGAVAVCASAGYLLKVAAEDDRIKAVSTVAAWLHDSKAVELIYGGSEGVAKKISEARTAKEEFAKSGVVAYIPSISTTDSTAAMFGAFDYYLNERRGAVPQWGRQFAVMSWEDWLLFDPMTSATKVMQPVLMIHSDVAVLGDNVKRYYSDLKSQHKELHWTKGTQFDFYDQPVQVAESIAKIKEFFTKNL